MLDINIKLAPTTGNKAQKWGYLKSLLIKKALANNINNPAIKINKVPDRFELEIITLLTNILENSFCLWMIKYIINMIKKICEIYW